MDTIDIAYLTSIIVILLGGAFCIAFFGSKEKNKRDRLEGSFRFKKVRGEVIRAPGKPSLFEFKDKFYYLEKKPFPVDAAAEGAKAPDGRTYKAIVMCTAFITEENSQTAAEHFFGFTVEEICDLLSDPLENALKAVVEKLGGEAEKEALSAKFIEEANAAVSMFGVSVIKVNTIKTIEEGNKSEQS